MNHPMFLTQRLDGDLAALPVHSSGAPMFSTAVSRRTGELLYVDPTGALKYGVDGFEFRPTPLKPPHDRSQLVVTAGTKSWLAVSVDAIVAATYSDIPLDYTTNHVTVCSAPRTDKAPHPAWGLSFAPSVFYPAPKRLKPTYDYAEPIEGEIWAPLERLGIIVSSHNRFKYARDMEHCVTVPRREYAKVIINHSEWLFHHLVCEAFHGSNCDPNERRHVDHRDGDAANNHPHNLTWASAYENNNNRVMSARQMLKKKGRHHWQIAIVPLPKSRLTKCADK